MMNEKLALRILAATGLFLIAGFGPLVAQRTAEIQPGVAEQYEFPLTIQNIMRGVEVVGQSPVGVSWTEDSEWIYFSWKPAGGAWSDSRDLYRVPADGGTPELIPAEVADTIPLDFARGDLSSDGRYRARSFQGDIFLIDRRTGERRRLTWTNAQESQAHFNGDDSGIFFREGDDLFLLDLDSGLVKQLTDLRSGPEPGEEGAAVGQRAYLENQQSELFEHIRTDEIRDSLSKARRDRSDARRLNPVYLAPGERVGPLSPNASGSHIVVRAFKPAEGSLGTIVPDWVTESGYTEDLNVRTKVGDNQSTSRIGLLTVETGEITFLDLAASGRSGDAAEDSSQNAGAENDPVGDEKMPPSTDPDLAGVGFVGWNDAGTHALLFALDFDYNEWRLYTLEAATGELTLLDSQQDQAWVGGPCSSRQAGPCAGWIPGSDRAWYVSEETGWAHLYTINADGSYRHALTNGEWEVRRVLIPEGWDRFLLHTSETSAFDTQPWSMDFDGSNRQLLLDAPGIYAVTPSPDGQRLAVVYSTSNRPSELFVTRNRVGADMKQVTVSPGEDWLAFPWKEAEVVYVPAEDGTSVPARIYRPEDLGAEPNGAGVVFVHGAGYLQNVHNGWSGYYREYQFHHFLAAQGYVVLDIDYRGSAGYGRDWRTAIYRWMGGKDLSDQVDGARYLVHNEGVDADRLGIYGGSYGGFITLMALFTAPGTFQAGAALRSVTDWAHYNHGYTARILNQPQEDDEAYRMSSPIYHAEDFEGHLLMAHGMVDTNVHFSGVVRLAQRLIELGKENWELAVYPVENHGFVEPASWTDEYRRIYELFDRVIGHPSSGR
jgi:dipeptidyl aminopeptidase/acylaminoacyl peptidase